MKNFTKKSILQKTIITIILALLLSNFIVPTYSHAGIGGVLMDPVADFFAGIGDAVINLLQKCMTGDWGGFQINGKFLVDSETFFDPDNHKYDYMKTTEEGEKINPEDPNNGFNKTLLFKSTQDYHIPIATYSPEQIFAGNVAGLDINFINPNHYEKKDGTEVESSAAKLQPAIATWYVALRNLTVVGLLSVLVYVGIRIIISSTASDKAKYKQMLMDWLVALCLVFFLHYIMSFTLTLVDSITNAIAGDGEETVIITVEGKGSFKTNLLGAARFKTQYDDFGQKVAYLIMYLALVIYTLMFTWFYLKRLLMMAFLTLIAPVVALTYPIDKMNDGKAQAFDSWFKEYVFNALIQPFHLIIYTVFVGTAMDLASSNIIYMMAALYFIMSAEKILRKFFGFEKAGAGTLGALGGFTAANVLNKLGKGKGGGGKAPGGKPTPEGEKPPRMDDKNNDIDEIKNPDDINNQTDPSQQQSQKPSIFEALKDKVGDSTIGRAALAVGETVAKAGGAAMKAGGKVISGAKTMKGKLTQNKAVRKLAQNKAIKGINNLRKHHNLTRRGAIKGVKKLGEFGLKTAFKASTGTLAAAVAAASGGGLAGAGAAFLAGASVGDRVANVATRVPSAIRKEIDVFNGNSNMQKQAEIKEWYNDDNNFNYFRNKLTKENGGTIPSDKRVKEEMQKYDPYLQRGIKDIKEMLQAQKGEMYTGSAEQAALIAAIGKEKRLTEDILNDKNKTQARQENLKQEFMNKGYTEPVATKQAEYTINVLKAQNDVAHNLKPIQPTKPPKNKK